MRIAIDTGGTFTDCVYLEGGELRVLKVFSTPCDPRDGILSALVKVNPARHSEIRHGTTIGTNALLERKGARVAFVTTAGFEDAIAIGRQARGRLYDWFWRPQPPLAPAGLRFGINERTLPDGTILRKATKKDLAALLESVRQSAPEAVAVSLLFSFANSTNERAVAARLRELRIPVSVSHEILPEFREYERASTVLVNAYLAPRVGGYLRGFERVVQARFPGSRLSVMQSSGGIVSAAEAVREPVRTLLSGPAGGVAGARAVARMSGFRCIISLDMGGTSTDVALAGEDSAASRESVVAGMPVAVPMLDIHTVGAGGGSIARFDSGGALRVGPESAGADPICFGRGAAPTVTDANLILGRIAPEFFLGGGTRLDAGRVRAFFEETKGKLKTVEAFAQGIVSVAEATMGQAIRLISVERGHDPRDFVLISFGGAGPMHACALARALRIPRVLVPRFPGALSALGILISDVIKDYSRTVMLPPDSDQLERHFRELERRGRREMREQGPVNGCFRSLDVRYRGQGYELNVKAGTDAVKRFHRAHARRYGYADESRPVEVVNARVRIVSSTERVPFSKQPSRRGNARQAIRKEQRAIFESRALSAKVYDRALLRAGDLFRGPAIIGEYSATTVVPPGCTVRVDEYGHLSIAVK